MQYVNLGRSGLKVSRIGLGASVFGTIAKERPYALDFERALPIFQRALELGITFFDTSELYSQGTSEEILGRLLKECGTHREDVVIASKVSGQSYEKPAGSNRYQLSRKHILNAIDQSLKRLQTDYIDLYQIHRLDHVTPFEETLGALEECVRAGKVRYLGVSSMYAWEFERLLSLQEKHGFSKFISIQNYYNLAYREEEREMLPLCLDRGIGVLPWGALSAGLLSGNVSRDGTKHTARAASDLLKKMIPPTSQDFDIQDRVREVASRLNVSMAQVALAWVLSKPGISMSLLGATKVDQVSNSVEALSVSLSAEDCAYLEDPYRPVMPQTI